MLTICILIFLAMYFHRPLGSLLGHLKNVKWEEHFETLWTHILRFSKSAGRATLRPLILFYYVMQSPDTSTLDKALIYGCIAYVVIPFSLLPRVVYSFLGIIDEAAAVAYVYGKVHDKITPSMELRADDLLDSWFGPESCSIIPN